MTELSSRNTGRASRSRRPDITSHTYPVAMQCNKSLRHCRQVSLYLSCCSYIVKVIILSFLSCRLWCSPTLSFCLLYFFIPSLLCFYVISFISFFFSYFFFFIFSFLIFFFFFFK